METILTETFELPGVREIRQRIESTRTQPHRMALMFQYVTGARASEVCGSYGIAGSDYEGSSYDDEACIIFKVKTAKRKGRIRFLAIPLNPEYEPWGSLLASYFLEHRERSQVFPFTTRTLQTYAVRQFANLRYPIEEYLTEDGRVPFHLKNLVTHGLRHIRATELLTKYGFDQIDLTIFMGWKFSRTMLPGVADRYLYMQWSRYFPKLLKPFQNSVMHKINV